MKYAIGVVVVLSLLIQFPGYSAKKEKAEETQDLTAQLLLSGEQKEELKETYRILGEKAKKLQTELKVETARLGQELKKDKPSKGRVRKIAAKIKKINNRLFDNRIDEILATKKILTHEQYSQLQQIRREKFNEIRKRVKKMTEERKR
ncbi:MAG: hypothetical protein JSW17_00280 [Candidatus Omnitrophota bacterium]|nr:MAG: hypothetical protein JSW17_00280 [Candidatus Omnitrophota bacterium]